MGKKDLAGLGGIAEQDAGKQPADEASKQVQSTEPEAPAQTEPAIAAAPSQPVPWDILKRRKWEAKERRRKAKLAERGLEM